MGLLVVMYASFRTLFAEEFRSASGEQRCVSSLLPLHCKHEPQCHGVLDGENCMGLKVHFINQITPNLLRHCSFISLYDVTLWHFGTINVMDMTGSWQGPLVRFLGTC